MLRECNDPELKLNTPVFTQDIEIIMLKQRIDYSVLQRLMQSTISFKVLLFSE